MPPTSRRTTSTTSPEAPQSADPEPAAPAPPKQTTRQERLPSSAKPSPEEAEPNTVVLRLPFLTVSMSRPTVRPVKPISAPEHPLGAETTLAAGSFGLQRVMFYGGVAALGVAGLVDWPVAAAIAAGTYIAARTRGTEQAPTA